MDTKTTPAYVKSQLSGPSAQSSLELAVLVFIEVLAAINRDCMGQRSVRLCLLDTTFPDPGDVIARSMYGGKVGAAMR